jgi:hypothetical protein
MLLFFVLQVLDFLSPEHVHNLLWQAIFTFEIHKDKIILKNVGTHEIIDKGFIN